VENLWLVQYSERGFQIYLLSASLKCREDPWRRAWSHHCPSSCSRHIHSFPFKRYLFCHILAMKTVAMEDAQWSRHCGRTQLIPSQLCVFTKKRLQFSRRQHKKSGRGRERRVQRTLAHISISEEGPEGDKKNGGKKQLHCWGGGVGLPSLWHNQKKDPGASIDALYGEHAVHQPSTTRIREGERLRAGGAFTAALNILQNDLKAKPVYTRSLSGWHLVSHWPDSSEAALEVFPHCRRQCFPIITSTVAAKFILSCQS